MRASALAALTVEAIFFTMQCRSALFAAGLGAFAGMLAGAIAAADSVMRGMAGGAITGGVGHIPRGNQRAYLPPGVRQESFDLWQGQIDGAQVKLSGHLPDSVRVDGVPPACMVLATVLTGNPTQNKGTVHVPIRSASLEYHGLAQNDLKQLGEALKTKDLM